MKFGLMSTFDLGRLREILDAKGMSYEIEASKKDVAEIDHVRSEAGISVMARPLKVLRTANVPINQPNGFAPSADTLSRRQVVAENSIS